ncbi:hypothetical protein [Microbacterium sp. MYb66]|jgi:hypothetical protein|uniref:hypothetical protein n=1 Tax=Microbacterium sp. MYb66 TaxID=1848692 RepID=UPI000D000B58|nr:hypothetical protein [Microbacterium sp. MYb66]PRA79789.1 hypothetical protein CQ045_14675 [Microbacterium sp. MYb66]
MQMNEPQVWTLIGVFAAFMLGSLTLLIRQNDRMITSLRGELSAKLDGMDAKFEARFDGMDARFDGMDAKFDARLGSIDRRLEDLDKEVANLAMRFWGSR